MKTVEHYMTRHPHAVHAGETAAAAAEIMKRVDCHHLPVLDGKALVGVVSDRDLRLLARADLDAVPVKDVCVDEPLSVDVDTSVSAAAAIMAERHTSSVLVTEDGALAGIFTSTDACRALADLALDGEAGA